MRPTDCWPDNRHGCEFWSGRREPLRNQDLDRARTGIRDLDGGGRGRTECRSRRDVFHHAEGRRRGLQHDLIADRLFEPRRIAEEASNPGQRTRFIDLTKIDRRLPTSSVGVNRTPEEADHVIVQIYAAHHFEAATTVLAMDLSHGGHLTHGAPVSHMGKVFNFVRYESAPQQGGAIDFAALMGLAKVTRPKIVLCG